MAQDTTPALVLYVGDGVQTRFDVPFDKGPFGEIKVAFVRRGLTDYTWGPDTYSVDGYLYAWNGGVYTKTLTVDTDTPLYDKEGVATGDTWTEGMYREPKNDIFTNAYIEWTGDAITSNDVICIIRVTEKDQPYSYPNNQKHIERALDHLSRQIQELQNASENALHVDPSWNYTMDDERKMDPINWLQTIVRSKGLTLREVRIDNDYIEYTTDDPDSETKTWNVIAGVKTGNAGVVSHIRETKVWDEEEQVYVPFLEYSVDGGNSWKPAGRAASELEMLYVKKTGDTMTGTLTRAEIPVQSSPVPLLKIQKAGEQTAVDGLSVSMATSTPAFYFGGNVYANNYSVIANYFGSAVKKGKAYLTAINNGYDIGVPVTNSADTLALKSQVDLAANSGSQLTNKGVWYAKMYAATTPSAATDGTNYADFSQVDGNGDPIIVIYERQSGAWVQTETITPPAEYNGYVTVTSKIWDIPEQSGQQGGEVLWSHNQKTFTPYPRIISTSGLAITNSTFSNGTLTNVITEMPANPVAKTVANKQYVDAAVAAMSAYLPDLFDTKWKDYTMSRTGWALADGTWKTAVEAYTHLAADYDNISSYLHPMGTVSGVNYYRDPSRDVPGATYEYAFSSFDETTVTTVYSNTSAPEGGTDHFYNGSGSGATDLGVLEGGGQASTSLKSTIAYEKIGNTTVVYVTAADGHKICLADQETNINAIYTATGVAWYYMLDEGNQRFKLPRTQHGFVGYRDVVGDYVAPGLPNITGDVGAFQMTSVADKCTGAFVYKNFGESSYGGGGSHEGARGASFDASRSSSVYGNSTTVQAPATQMYLYFYIGA